MHSSGFTQEQAKAMADNLERMYRDFPLGVVDDDEIIPNEDFETWFYQQDTSSRRNMSTKQMFKRYNQMCMVSGGMGYVRAG